MEAIAAVNRGGVAGCSSLHRESLPVVSSKRNWVLNGRNYHIGSRRGGVRTVRQSLFSSDSFQDQSHVQFYLNDRRSGAKEKLGNSVFRKAVPRLDEAVDCASQTDVELKFRNRADVKAKKMEMKMQKKLKKAARAAAGSSSSSSSSSSSESEACATTERSIRTQKTTMEKLRRDWERISQSPLMQSIPTISPNFVIEQSQAQQGLTSPVENSCCTREAEAVSSAVLFVNNVMAMRISSCMGADTSVNAGRLPITMADIDTPRQSSSVAVAAGVEVCMGGKCKKAGAQEVLSAFQANGVAASACNKCMKKCKLAINLRVHQDGEDVPQMYSGIGVEDVGALSQKHFGALASSRAPDSFLPSFGAVQV